MPGTANITFLPLDGLGGNKFYAESGRDECQLQPLQAGGQSWYTGGTANLALRTPYVIASTAEQGNLFEVGAMLLPTPYTMAGFGGGVATLKLPTPYLLTIAATVNKSFQFNLTLPSFTGSLLASGIAGSGGSGNLFLATPTITMTVGAHADGLGSGLSMLGALVASGSYSNGSVANLVMAGTPSLVASSSNYSMSGSAVLTLSSTLIPGPYSKATLTTSMPALYATGRLTTPSFDGYDVNIRNGAVTHITNWPFKQLARCGPTVYAIGNDGNLYTLGGDLDNGQPIPWSFATGADDLGSPATKYIPYIYIDGIIEGQIQIALTDDRQRVFAYEYDTGNRPALHMPHKRKLGNGIRTRNVAFTISSTSGAYVEIDSLEPEGTNTQRSV